MDEKRLAEPYQYNDLSIADGLSPKSLETCFAMDLRCSNPLLFLALEEQSTEYFFTFNHWHTTA